MVWTAFEGEEHAALKRIASDYQEQTGQKIVILKVPFATLRRKVLVAAPALQGPDLLIGPHDWLGILQTADLLSPIPDAIMSTDQDKYYPVCLNAVSYGNNHYMAPLMMDCVVMARNTELCPEQPANLDELVRLAKECEEKHDVTGFAYELDDLYFSWAFLSGFGADFLEPFSKKDLDVDSINFATPESIAGANWVADLEQKHHIVPEGIENEIVVDLFLNKKIGMMLCGPWNLGAMRKAGVAYQLEPIPPGPKGPCRSFVGITGAMLSRYTADKKGVQEFLAHLASPEVGAVLCESSGRAPTGATQAEALAKKVRDEQTLRDISLFASAAQQGTPLPNHPAMQPVWDTMKQALELITGGQSEASVELEQISERVRNKIRFMME